MDEDYQQFVVCDVGNYESSAVANKIYSWKVGQLGNQRLFGTKDAAAQALIDYLVGPWTQVGGDPSVEPEDFFIVSYTGTMNEDELSSQEVKGLIDKSELVNPTGAHTVVLQYNLQPKKVELGEKGYGAVLKKDFNAAKLGNGSSRIRIWVTGTKATRQRIYPTLAEAKEGLQAYYAADWDKQIEVSKLNLEDFLLVEVANPTGVLQPDCKAMNCALAEIISAPKSFTADDELF